MYRAGFGFHEGGLIGTRKPLLRHSVTLDESLSLSNGLQSLLLFEQCTNNGHAACGMMDYAAPLA